MGFLTTCFAQLELLVHVIVCMFMLGASDLNFCIVYLIGSISWQWAWTCFYCCNPHFEFQSRGLQFHSNNTVKSTSNFNPHFYWHCLTFGIIQLSFTTGVWYVWQSTKKKNYSGSYLIVATVFIFLALTCGWKNILHARFADCHCRMLLKQNMWDL